MGIAIIYGLQDRMIYNPQPYTAGADVNAARLISRIYYRIESGDQTAYYAAQRMGDFLPDYG